MQTSWNFKVKETNSWGNLAHAHTNGDKQCVYVTATLKYYYKRKINYTFSLGTRIQTIFRSHQNHEQLE